MGFFGVKPSTIMGKIVWSGEGCQRLHSLQASHGWGQELPSHNWNQDSVEVVVPSSSKNINIWDMLENMTEYQC